MRTGRRRVWAFAFSAILLVAIVLLSSGLSDVRLEPGQRFSRGEESDADNLTGDGSGGLLEALILKAISAGFLLMLLAVPAALVLFILSRVMRKELLRQMAQALILLALLLAVASRIRPAEPLQEAQPVSLELAPAEGAPLVEFVASPPPSLLWAARVGLALLGGALVGGVVWFVWLRRRRQAGTLEQLAQQAKGALHALQAGADLRDTVLRCYFEMSRVLSQERGLTREQAMTPREFEKRLAEAGLPADAVGQLTRLFEGVRYGARPSVEAEQQQAVTCLTAIVEACGGRP